MKKLLIIASLFLVGCDGAIVCKHPKTGEFAEVLAPCGPRRCAPCSAGGFWLDPTEEERQEWEKNKTVYICNHSKIEGQTFRWTDRKGKSCQDFGDGNWEEASEK